ncbi:MAG: glycoside hydrolase family 127 protein [Acidobacteriota bacterium]|nr:glycoside hydrolase family 127 protein [Acidobacteriota bacterium]
MFWLKTLSTISLFNLMRLAVLFALGALSLTSLANGVPQFAQRRPKPVVQDTIKDRFVPADFDQQKIEGLLGERMRVNLEERLLKVDDRVLLAAYRQRPGVQTWIGEHAAKFIHAAANTVAYTNDAKLRAKLDRTVRELIATQEPDGYLGTYLAKDRWKDWDVWAHKYNLIALLSYYELTGYEPALKASRKMGDLLTRTFGEGAGQRDITKDDWHRGMASSSVLEAMCMLYRYTGEGRYLDFCRYITRAWDQPHGPKIIQTLMLTGSVREVANNKAYEMMSCLVGLLDLYRLTGDETFLKPVLLAWKDITTKRLYITGTTSWDEHFREDFNLKATDDNVETGVGEGCVTVTWMQINWHLLRLTGETPYKSELERTIYNALLAAQNPHNGEVCYFVPLIGRKAYGAVSHGVPGVSCCTSSVPRGISLIPGILWGARGNGIAVNLYTPGEARVLIEGDGQDKVEVNLKLITDFPISGDVTLKVEPSSPKQFPLFLRVPEWCAKFVATVDGKSLEGKRGEYLAVDRLWRPSDSLSIKMDMTVRPVSGGKSYSHSRALMRGPQVLAFDTTLNNSALNLAGLRSFDPVVIQFRDASQKLPKGWRGVQTYALDGVVWDQEAVKEQRDLILVPFSDAGQQGGEYRVWLPVDSVGAETK